MSRYAGVNLAESRPIDSAIDRDRRATVKFEGRRQMLLGRGANNVCIAQGSTDRGHFKPYLAK
jgi:hypothetical protein